MPGVRGHILLLAACTVLCLAGCSDGGRVIPKKDMIALYADMFLADQWLRENPEARKVADTTLFFDPIFRRHGYTFQDYEKSLEYYSGRTEELTEVMDSVSRRLKKRSEYYQKLSERIRKVDEENDRLRVYYAARDFSADSAVWNADGVLWPVRDSIPQVEDGPGSGGGAVLPPLEDEPLLERRPEKPGKARLRMFEEREAM